MRIKLSNSNLKCVADKAEMDQLKPYRFKCGMVVQLVPSQLKWRLNTQTGYATCLKWIEGKYRNVTLHTLLIGQYEGLVTDHKNGNRLDNRMQNLRLATHAQNNYNRKKKVGATSCYKGVISNPQKTNCWTAYIKFKEKRIHIGVYSNEIDAAKARDHALKQIDKTTPKHAYNFK